jgi:hypothetical protein
MKIVTPCDLVSPSACRESRPTGWLRWAAEGTEQSGSRIPEEVEPNRRIVVQVTGHASLMWANPIGMPACMAPPAVRHITFGHFGKNRAAGLMA